MIIWMRILYLGAALCAAQEFADPARSRLPPSPSEWLAKQQRTGPTAVTSSSSGGPIFTPTSYGGDPTGAADSTAAVQAALDAAFAWTAPDPILAALNGTKLFHGGAAVDLGGGTYRVAKPLRLGSGLSLRLCCGSLLADGAAFPDDGASFMLANDAGSGEDQLEGLAVHDVFFDCNRRAAGAVRTSKALRVHLDRLYVAHFVAAGVRVEGGHETHVHNSWFGEWLWSEGHPKTALNAVTGTAIDIEGQDAWVSDVIVFSALRGIVMGGGAAVISNCHIYNGGAEALLVTGAAVRVLGSYFDFDGVVLQDPAAVDISHCMFLGGVGVELRSSTAGARCSGLTLVGNQFVVGDAPAGPETWRAVWRNETAGAFAPCSSTHIEANAFPAATYGPYVGQGFAPVGTRATRSLRQANATRWVVDFGGALVFDSIDSVQYSFELEEGFAVAAVRPRGAAGSADALRVTVETQAPVSGVLYVTVTQAA